jgi:hypothetical protein
MSSIRIIRTNFLIRRNKALGTVEQIMSLIKIFGTNFLTRRNKALGTAEQIMNSIRIIGTKFNIKEQSFSYCGTNHEFD